MSENDLYVKPLICAKDTAYVYEVDHMWFAKVDEIDLLEQKIPKLPKDWQSVAKMVVGHVRQFDIVAKNENPNNYTQPSKYADYYCLAQGNPQGNFEGQGHRHTDHKFLTDPKYWNMGLVRDMCNESQTIEAIMKFVGIYINITAMKRARVFYDDVQSGELIVTPVSPKQMAQGTAFAIYNVDFGGYWKDKAGTFPCEPLCSATLFPNEAAARQALDKRIDYGARYCIVPVSLTADAPLEMVNKGAREPLTEHQQSLLHEFNREVLSREVGEEQLIENKKSTSKKKM